MNSMARDVATWLDANTSLTLGTDLFGFQWNEKITVTNILVRDTSGETSDQPLLYEKPSVQVLVRTNKGGSFQTAWNKLELVHQALLTAGNAVTINSTEYLGFDPIGGMADLGRDENGRYVLTRNYSTHRQAQ